MTYRRRSFALAVTCAVAVFAIGSPVAGAAPPAGKGPGGELPPGIAKKVPGADATPPGQAKKPAKKAPKATKAPKSATKALKATTKAAKKAAPATAPVLRSAAPPAAAAAAAAAPAAAAVAPSSFRPAQSESRAARTRAARRRAARRREARARRARLLRSASSPVTRVVRTALPPVAASAVPLAAAPAAPAASSGGGGDRAERSRERRSRSSPLPIPVAPAVVERIVEVIPTFVWIILAALALLALGGIGAALFMSRRAKGVAAEALGLAAAAQTDPLTGVLNRRGLHQRLEAELLRASRYNRPLAISYLDISGFKAVNDRFGHRSGDQLLTAVADTLTAESRHEDLVGRVGGDEYLVALTEQDEAGAEHFWSRARRRLEAERDSIPGDWDVTTGTAVFPDDGEDLESLLRVADRRLYASRGIELR